MAVFKSKTFSDNILNWLKGTAMPAAPANLYLALFTTMPTTNAGASLVEVSGGAYARQQITPAMWAAITTNADSVTEQMSTNAQLTFPVATANWGTIVGGGIYDAVTAGNPLIYVGISSPQTVNTNNQFDVTAANFTITEV